MSEFSKHTRTLASRSTWRQLSDTFVSAERTASSSVAKRAYRCAVGERVSVAKLRTAARETQPKSAKAPPEETHFELRLDNARCDGCFPIRGNSTSTVTEQVVGDRQGVAAHRKRAGVSFVAAKQVCLVYRNE